VVPLVMFTTSRQKMGELVAPAWLAAVAVVIASAIIALNLRLLFGFVSA
jgi:manganese transport protein